MSLVCWFFVMLLFGNYELTLAQPRRQPCSPHPHGDNVVQFQVFLIGNGKMSFPTKKKWLEMIEIRVSTKKNQWEKLKQTWKSSQLLILSPLQQLVQTFNIWSTQAPKKKCQGSIAKACDTKAMHRICESPRTLPQVTKGHKGVKLFRKFEDEVQYTTSDGWKSSFCWRPATKRYSRKRARNSDCW